MPGISLTTRPPALPKNTTPPTRPWPTLNASNGEAPVCWVDSVTFKMTSTCRKRLAPVTSAPASAPLRSGATSSNNIPSTENGRQ